MNVNIANHCKFWLISRILTALCRLKTIFCLQIRLIILRLKSSDHFKVVRFGVHDPKKPIFSKVALHNLKVLLKFLKVRVFSQIVRKGHWRVNFAEMDLFSIRLMKFHVLSHYFICGNWRLGCVRIQKDQMFILKTHHKISFFWPSTKESAT